MLHPSTLLAAALVFGLGTVTTAPADADRPIPLTLPAPTGARQLGTVSLHLVDPGRRDPWVPDHPVRELMISIWYPAAGTAHPPRAPWMPPVAAAHFLAGEHVPAGAVTLPTTAGHLGAPVDRRGGRHPVLLYSPGSGTDRTIGTALVEDLASRGYVVVTIDHTHDAGEVEFPGGRVEVSALPKPDSREINTEAVAVREADTRFVLDQLTAIDHGADPDVDHAPLPPGIAGSLDLTRVGMFGWSIGGATAAATMHDDPRVTAGAGMDGTLYGPVVADGLDRPFLLFSSQRHNRDTDATCAAFWAHQRGWKHDFKLLGAEHISFTDGETLLPQLAGLLGLTAGQLAQQVGTIDPERAIGIERTYLAAYFDQQLRHRPSRLLDGPSPCYPEVRFLP